jgi:hypothetical protein
MDPILLAFAIGSVAAALVGFYAHVVGYDRDRSFYAVVLTVVAVVYVLFAAMAGGGRLLLPELLFFLAFSGLAAAGFRTSQWLIVAGLALHGAFDFIRYYHFVAPGAPLWWPAFCGSYDVVAAFALAMLIRHQRTAPRLFDS